MRKINQRGYKFYMVIGNKIESGWDYKEDALDHKNDLPDPKVGRILSKTYLKSQGIDPDDNASWLMGPVPGVSERREAPNPSPLSGPHKDARDEAIKRASEEARRTGEAYAVWMDRHGKFQVSPSFSARWEDIIAVAHAPSGAVSYKRYGAQESVREPRVVADFNTLEDLIEHARTELGATHVTLAGPDTRIYFPRGGQYPYEEARVWRKGGYWHAEGPGARQGTSLPRGARPIGARGQWAAERGRRVAERSPGRSAHHRLPQRRSR